MLSNAGRIIAGDQSLVDTAGVLQAYSQKSGMSLATTERYDTGPGVFCAIHAWTAVPELKAYINQPACQQMLRASAEAAMKANTNKFNELTNDLSVLVAADQILK